MKFTAYQVFLIIAFIAAGTTSTLLSKWVSSTTAKNSIGVEVKFRHPFLQTNGMFLGEFICLLIFYSFGFCKKVYSEKFLRKTAASKEAETNSPVELSENSIAHAKADAKQTKKFTWKKSWIFIFPALCDMTATSVMYVGLALTTASSYQMLRGAVIVFTGIASRIFLRKLLVWYQWLGMLVITAGLVIVGSGDMITDSKRCPDKLLHLGNNATELSKESDECDEEMERIHSILGDVIVIAAQIVVAFQLTYEEKVMKKYDIAPIEAIGWEGCFGFTSLTTLMVVLAHVKTNSKVWGHSPIPPYYMEDALDGLTQLKNNGTLLAAFLCIVCAICVAAVLGISLTKERSATTRTITDSFRTLVIWLLSVSLQLQQFHFLQPLGFFTLVVGMLLYYNFLIVPWIQKYFMNPTPEAEVSNQGENLGEV